MQIKSPADIAAVFMLEMSHIDQAHVSTILLDTKSPPGYCSADIHAISFTSLHAL
jgi:hypothetical protein